MQKIIVSSCLLGEPVRYNGKIFSINLYNHNNLTDKFEIISFCPEVCAGMQVPREPAEINSGDGESVLTGNSRVIDRGNRDVTQFFKKGAESALKTCVYNKALFVILKDGSPSCGSTYIYDGTFTGKIIKGRGVTTALLEKNGITVFNENFFN